MTGWLARRSVDAVVSAAAAILLLVALVHIMPGDPLAVILGDRPADAATVARLRERYGIDRSLPQALGDFARGVVHGDLGIALSEQRPVTSLLREHVGPTLLLGSLTLLINFTVGLALGLWWALHPATLRSRIVSAATVVGYALPTFAIGMVLVWVFAVELGWLPAAGSSDPLLAADAPLAEALRDRLAHLVLPLTAMVMATIAVPIRQQRSAALVAAAQPWVRAARARGLSPAVVAWRHCWRPALTPIVTLLGLWLPMLVSGAVLVESVFAWPGLGTLLAGATVNRDVPLVIGAGVLLVIAVQLGSLLADVLYRVVDPAQRQP